MGRVLGSRLSILVILIAILVLFSATQAFALDKLTGFVNDEAGVISPEVKAALEEELYTLKLNTSVEMAVATVKSLEGIPIEEYSLNLAHKTLGEKGKDNGVLILLAVEDREYRIEVGYGLEPVLNAAKLGRIGRNSMEPLFKEGKYDLGLYSGVKELSAVLKGDDSLETEGTGSWGAIAEMPSEIMMFVIIWGIFIFLGFVLPAIFAYKKVKKDKLAKHQKADFNDIMAAIIVASMFNKGRGGRGGFGGGSSGGFGGFGGGGFGGGGFSGRF